MERFRDWLVKRIDKQAWLSKRFMSKCAEIQMKNPKMTHGEIQAGAMREIVEEDIAKKRR